MFRSDQSAVPRRRQNRFAFALGATCAAVLSGLALPAAAIDVDLVLLASGLSNPVDIASAGDDRLYVVEQEGVIRIVESDGTVLGTPFLDIQGQVSCCSERGLLGLAFDPDHANNGFFFVNYTDNSGDTVVARFQRNGPDTADPGSELPILTVDQPFSNHNGGDINFGPDGYLYVGLGDGGAGCDSGDHAQDPLDLLGKMLRIDVSNATLIDPYDIPAGNPFVGDPSTLDEIWAQGLRNPWRFGFDRSSGDLFIADVGQNQWEEINFQAASSSGAENYGWDCFEGTHLASDPPSSCSTTAVCPPANNVAPVHEYSHSLGCSITGGFVYRGAQSPTLLGHYFFTDYCSGTLATLTSDGGGGFNLATLSTAVPGNPTTFGEGSDGEIYIGTTVSGDGRIYRIEEDATAQTCPAAPIGGCLTPGKSLFKITDKDADGATEKDRLLWKFLKGPQTGQDDFGDPTGATDYRLCVYAGTSGALALSASIPGGGFCAASDCWKTVGTKGYRFKDKLATNSEGVTIVKLLGGDTGKAKILVKGAGANLDLAAATLPLDDGGDIQVQVLRSDASDCWSETYPAAAIVANDDAQFKAKTP